MYIPWNSKSEKVQ